MVHLPDGVVVRQVGQESRCEEAALEPPPLSPAATALHLTRGSTEIAPEKVDFAKREKVKYRHGQYTEDIATTKNTPKTVSHVY
ncbi:hypothetical protein Tneu_0942 [Pyrobaculum neutrophilum V24Sta]|uniref:Uncharacterized protein n=1 Tax=Pyrobaculum neutrophilum (strain DSM 2338 / JCM 9278 / NBRC 100436 / V24Sta) TaxID=444157 RepID=B1YDL5_PYRNV|nr:hypothetical protein Tneu_0942 [Pyrobaculum neutrophilum V24Sta]